MDLVQVVEATMGKLVKSGKIEAAIEKKLESTVTSIVEDELKEYSELGKAVREKVKSVLMIDFDKLSLPEYNTMIMNNVMAIINEKILGESQKAIEAALKKFLKPLEKDSYTITELVEMFISDSKEYSNDGEPGERFTFAIKRESKFFTYILLDRKKGKTEYQCEYRIGLSDGKIFTITHDQSPIHNSKADFGLYGFSATLFQLYAAQVKIVDDNPDTDDLCYWPEEEYED